MIRHIVFFSARKREDLPTIVEGLRGLASIPGSTTFEVTENRKADRYANDIDIVVYAEFPDEAALAAYKTHPTYEATTSKVRPLRELRFSADVDAASG